MHTATHALAVVIDLVIPGRQEGVLRFLELVWSVLAMGLDFGEPLINLRCKGPYLPASQLCVPAKQGLSSIGAQSHGCGWM